MDAYWCLDLAWTQCARLRGKPEAKVHAFTRITFRLADPNANPPAWHILAGAECGRALWADTLEVNYGGVTCKNCLRSLARRKKGD